MKKYSILANIYILFIEVIRSMIFLLLISTKFSFGIVYTYRDVMCITGGLSEHYSNFIVMEVTQSLRKDHSIKTTLSQSLWDM